MQKQLQVLWQLQQLEQRKAQLLAEREKVSTDEVRQLWQEISRMQQMMAKDRDQLQQQQQDCSQQEAQLQQVAEQGKQIESLLYGGRVKNVKELEQLRTKHSLIRADVEQLENRIFTTLESCEQLQAKIADAEQLLQTRRQQHALKQQDFAKTCAANDARLGEIKQQCDELVAKVDPSLFGKYVAISHKRAQPIAKVVNGICSGCKLAIPVQQLDRSRTKLNVCENCGRLLLQE